MIYGKARAVKIMFLELLLGVVVRAESRWSKVLSDAVLKHVQNNPLSPSEVEAVLDLYRRGEPLCCSKGRENLRKLRLDPYWVEHLNNYAYDHLGCSPEDKPGGSGYDRGYAKLSRMLQERVKELYI